MGDEIGRTLGQTVAAAIVALAVSLWLSATIYVSTAGIVVPGRVVEKKERIVMPGGDSWKHVFEITYEFRPLDSPYVQTSGHRIDAALYHRLRVGSPVAIRYSRARFLRHMEGVGSFVVGSSPRSRLPYGPPDSRDSAEIAGVLIAALIAGIAYRRTSKRLGVVAGVVLAACIPVLLLVSSGLFLLPSLYWAWRDNPGKGYGWALLGTIVLCAAVVSWRVPRATPMPSDAVRTTAIVRQIKLVDQIWTTDMEGHPDAVGGEPIRAPFQMLELEFTPRRANEPVHVVERIDRGSFPGLHQGAVVPIVYSASDPQVARIAGGSRSYALKAEIYLLGLTYGFGAALTFIVFPISRATRRFMRASAALGARSGPSVGIGRAAATKLSANDPRRKVFEQILRSLNDLQDRSSK